MSAAKKDDSPEGKNSWITPTVITAIIGLIGTIITLYFQYITNSRPLEIAATETAAARIFQLTLVALTPTPIPLAPSATTTLPPTPTPETSTTTPTSSPTPTATSTAPVTPFTRTPGPDELEFCINSRNINVRSGPGTDSSAIGILTFLDCLYFDGQNPDGTWIHISPNQTAYAGLSGGWVRSNLVRPQDFTLLPTILPPTATSTPEG
jgi:hypothetical protein